MIIAEIGQAHEGSLGMAHAYIDALASSGVDAIKLQTHIAEAESSPDEKFRIQFSQQDKTRYDYWKRMEFTPEQWAGLKSHCDKIGLEFISSPFSIAAVELLEKLNIKTFKVGSGEVNNLLLLDRIAKTGKPIILSTGMSSIDELESSINYIKKYGNNISLMQCTTAYPCPPERWGLNLIKELKDKFFLPVGYSDHSGDIFACLAAAALGAELFEFHVVFDKKQFGPDVSSSITISEVHSLTNGIRNIKKALINPVSKSLTDSFYELKIIFGKSLAVNKDLEAGHEIKLDDLESKKPSGMGIPASEFQLVLGKKLRHKLDKWSFLKKEDIIE